MDDLVLRAEPRSILGKKVKRLRREGLIPGVVYGPVIDDPVAVSVDHRTFAKFYAAHGHATLLTLNMDDGDQQVFIHEVQVEPVKHTPLHIDFFAPNLRQALVATVPIALHNVSGDAEGVLTTLRTEIEVRGLPTAIPPQIDGDLSELMEVGDALRVSHLHLPEGVEAITDQDEVIAMLSAESAPEPVEEPEGEEAEEGVEGEGGTSEEPAEDDGSGESDSGDSED
jgi:large subunit ribosomal protein L25